MKNWTRIDIECEAETADILAVELTGVFGVSVEFITGGVRFYLDSVRFAEEEEHVRGIVQSTSALSGERATVIGVSQIPDEDWSQTWKAHFKPLQVGRRFLVSPTWEPVPADPERLVILIDPGRAFGTGHHETTRLCLEWLENCPDPDLNAASSSLLDVGTGSGILAIGAALLGFGNVTGIDNDPEAVEVAEQNIALNGFSEKIRICRAIPEEVNGFFDVIISNIQSGPLMTMSKTIESKLGVHGRLALSGLLLEQADEVRAAYEKMGLTFTGASTAGEWTLLAFRK